MLCPEEVGFVLAKGSMWGGKCQLVPISWWCGVVWVEVMSESVAGRLELSACACATSSKVTGWVLKRAERARRRTPKAPSRGGGGVRSCSSILVHRATLAPTLPPTLSSPLLLFLPTSLLVSTLLLTSSLKATTPLLFSNVLDLSLMVVVVVVASTGRLGFRWTAAGYWGGTLDQGRDRAGSRSRSKRAKGHNVRQDNLSVK